MCKGHRFYYETHLQSKGLRTLSTSFPPTLFLFKKIIPLSSSTPLRLKFWLWSETLPFLLVNVRDRCGKGDSLLDPWSLVHEVTTLCPLRFVVIADMILRVLLFLFLYGSISTPFPSLEDTGGLTCRSIYVPIRVYRP